MSLVCSIHSYNLKIVLYRIVILSLFRKKILDLKTSFSFQKKQDQIEAGFEFSLPE